MKPEISILISSYNRSKLFTRCLYSIAKNPPTKSFEVIIADEESTEPVIDIVKEFSSAFYWKFIKLDLNKFTEKTGLTKYFNNPCWSNNTAFTHSSGNFIFMMGNEMIATDGCFDTMIHESSLLDAENFIIFSKTYNLPINIHNQLDIYGSNLSKGMIKFCEQWPLQKPVYMTGCITNYLSLSSRSLWEKIKGYNEQYFGGIACEDTDFYRRASKTDNFKEKYIDAISLHQDHGGRSMYNPKGGLPDDKWLSGHQINLDIQKQWTGTYHNPQTWDFGSKDFVKEVITNEI